jgi:hypothetical protein
LESVTVNAIPDAYQDVTSVTAAEGEVLVGKVFVTSTGAVKTGTMPNNGAVSKELVQGDYANGYTIPAGYHNGSGKVNIKSQWKGVTPTKSRQIINGDNQAFLTSVTVEAIPDKYQDVTGVTATKDKVLEGSAFVDSEGSVVNGAMTNNGAVTATIDGLTTASYTIPKGYHSGSGTVSLTSDIEEALAAI